MDERQSPSVTPIHPSPHTLCLPCRQGPPPSGGGSRERRGKGRSIAPTAGHPPPLTPPHPRSPPRPPSHPPSRRQMPRASAMPSPGCGVARLQAQLQTAHAFPAVPFPCPMTAQDTPNALAGGRRLSGLSRLAFPSHRRGHQRGYTPRSCPHHGVRGQAGTPSPSPSVAFLQKSVSRWDLLTATNVLHREVMIPVRKAPGFCKVSFEILLIRAKSLKKENSIVSLTSL